MIPLARPEITDADIEAVAQVLRTGQLVQGPRVAEFESAVEKLTDGGEIVAVSNCTAALHLSLLALGVGTGDHVGVATLSWPATANAIVLCGATPVFIDIEPVTLGVDPRALEHALRKGPRLKALIPVHAFGNLANMPAVVELAQGHAVPVVEDAACALGATLNGKAAGSFGIVGCFSFHPRKAATTGEGGAIHTSDTSLARKIRMLRNHGLDPSATTADFVDAGFNLRMTEFQAALGTSQLERYGELIARRRTLARRYDELLKDLPVTTPRSLGEDSHIYQSYVVHLERALAPRRTTILSSLRDQGVEANIGTHHMPLITYYRRTLGHVPGDFPVTDEVAASAIALPMHSYLTDADQETVSQALRRAISG